MKPRIYTIATSHLDTSWNWTLETTLNEYLPKVAYENFPLFDKYPEYKFSFEGSYRYELLEEYYPEYFEKIKQLIYENRWFVSGSAYENGDVNIPSPEALLRNFLYGNSYFYRKFGKRSTDVFLPDCFGFGYALPSVAAHSNLTGFTTQKLTWSSYCGVPFDIGKWYGVDGKYIYASMDTRGYQKVFKKSVRSNFIASTKLQSNMRKYSLPLTAIFHGVGDRGGAPKEESVATVLREMKENPDKKTEVVCASSDEIFRDMNTLLTDEQKNRLPVWNGELVSTNHGAGGYTSRTLSKRLNRRGELLCEAAERLSLAAELLCGREYNRNVLDICWKRIIAHQFHDDITGTSIMDCYKRNWNDYFLSLNQASQEYTSAVGALTELIDTSGFKGMPVAVCNPLQYSRKECVYLETSVPDANSLRVFDSDGNEVLSAVTEEKKGEFSVWFEADVKPLSVTAYDIRKSDKACELKSPVKASTAALENDNIRVQIDENGDISSVYDKQLRRELIKNPVSFAVFDYEGCYGYAAWEVNYEEMSVPPQRRTRLVSIELVSSGAAAATLKIKKQCGDSDFTQLVTLTSTGTNVTVFNEVDWRCVRSLLKVEFPFTASDNKALYDLGLGVIERPNNTKRRFEVPAQMWAAVTDKSGAYTAYALSDSRIGWDKPNDNTLRLTCMHSPRHMYRKESGQHLLDFGINRFSFSIGGTDKCQLKEIQKAALCFNSPLAAFTCFIHKGKYKRDISVLSLSDDSVILRAFKKSEFSDEITVRFNEGTGASKNNVKLSLAKPVISAAEAFASEEKISDTAVNDGSLCFDIDRYGVKTFLLHTEHTKHKANKCKKIDLPYNADALSKNTDRKNADFLCGQTLPYELYPEKITSGGIDFETSHADKNVLLCGGEEIDLPENRNTVYILAASLNGDTEIRFKTETDNIDIKISDIFENVGAWDIYALSETGYVKNDEVAHVFTHTHRENEDIRGKNAYIFKYRFEVNDSKKLILPNNKDIIIFAACAVSEPVHIKALSPLYDRLNKRECNFIRTEQEDQADKITKIQGKKARFNFIKGYAARQLKRETDMF